MAPKKLDAVIVLIYVEAFSAEPHNHGLDFDPGNCVIKIIEIFVASCDELVRKSSIWEFEGLNAIR
jgi:hypothetical protein